MSTSRSAASVRYRPALALLLGLSTFPCLACKAGDDSPAPAPRAPLATCEDAAAHLRECGLLTEGNLRCAWWGLVGDFNDCVTDCLARLSCHELWVDICYSPHEEPGPVDTCAEACIPYARCDDGTRLEAELFCDGFEDDCPDGSDEDCPDFTCLDGTTIPGGYACDLAVDCAEAEDELGCPGVLLCASGDEVFHEFDRCASIPECTDGSDDADCEDFVHAQYLCPGEFVCRDGLTLDSSQFCDGTYDCVDREDETACH